MHNAELPPYYLFAPSAASGGLHDDLTQLTIHLTGPQGTPYADGIWRLHLKIPQDYPKSPPKAYFKTKIWHPNVEESTGSVCLDTLKRDWQSKLTLRDILIVSASTKHATGSETNTVLDYIMLAHKSKSGLSSQCRCWQAAPGGLGLIQPARKAHDIHSREHTIKPQASCQRSKAKRRGYARIAEHRTSAGASTIIYTAIPASANSRPRGPRIRGRRRKHQRERLFTLSISN